MRLTRQDRAGKSQAYMKYVAMNAVPMIAVTYAVLATLAPECLGAAVGASDGVDASEAIGASEVTVGSDGSAVLEPAPSVASSFELFTPVVFFVSEGSDKVVLVSLSVAFGVTIDVPLVSRASAAAFALFIGLTGVVLAIFDGSCAARLATARAAIR